MTLPQIFDTYQQSDIIPTYKEFLWFHMEGRAYIHSNLNKKKLYDTYMITV